MSYSDPNSPPTDTLMQSSDESYQPRDRRPWTEEEDESLRMAIEEGTRIFTSASTMLIQGTCRGSGVQSANTVARNFSAYSKQDK